MSQTCQNVIEVLIGHFTWKIACGHLAEWEADNGIICCDDCSNALAAEGISSCRKWNLTASNESNFHIVEVRKHSAIRKTASFEDLTAFLDGLNRDSQTMERERGARDATQILAAEIQKVLDDVDERNSKTLDDEDIAEFDVYYLLRKSIEKVLKAALARTAIPPVVQAQETGKTT